MRPNHEIRADFDARTIVIYQAFRKEIALPAVAKQTFVSPFSFHRMTWIKPSFLWLMERSNWCQKAGQEHLLAVRISRDGWEEALSQGMLTTPEKSVYPDPQVWRKQFDQALVHVQWDPERSNRGGALPYRSIQVGLSRHIINKYVDEWITEIRDLTPLVRKIQLALKSGRPDHVKKLLPVEKIYPLPEKIGKRLGMKQD